MPIEDARTAASGVANGSAGAIDAQAAVNAVKPAPTSNPEAGSEGNARSLVLLVRFKGDSLGDGGSGYNADFRTAGIAGMTTEWDYLRAQFNASETDGSNDYVTISLRSYLQTVSEGKHDLVSVFPQTAADGVHVEYITLPYTAEDYAGRSGNTDYGLIADTVAGFNTAHPGYDAAQLDVDGDGLIDNLVVLAAVSSAASQSDWLWPHKAEGAGWNLMLGSKQVGTYNVIDASDTPGDLNSSGHANIGTLAHEYLHTLGAKDYYRQSISGDPVSMWDIMGAPDALDPWPLAVTRQGIGWLDSIPEVADSGTYTLYQPGTGRQQAVMFKSPLNNSEYFVAEYRKKGSGQALDRGIGGSGLVVYRVNPTFAGEGNVDGNDYVYVFRPGETSLGAAEGDVRNAQLTAADFVSSNGRVSLGSSNFDAGVTDNTLFYSDGMNSGIVIEATEQAEDSITFSLTYPDYASQDLWDSVSNADGTMDSFGTDVKDVQVVSEGATVYALTESVSDMGAYTHRGMRHDGINWTDCGVVGTNLENGQLAAGDGKLYYLATDHSTGKAVLKRYGGGTSWVTVAQLDTGGYVGEPVISFVGRDLYVLADVGFANARLFKLVGEKLVSAAPAVPASYIVAPTVFALNGHPAVACGDFNAGNSSVFELVDGAWVVRSEVLGCAHYDTAAADGVTTYVYQHIDARSDPYLHVLDANGAVQKTVRLAQFKQYSLDSSLVAAGGYLYLSVVDGQGTAASVKTFVASVDALDVWSQVGSAVYKPGDTVSSTVAGGKVVVGVRNPIGKAAVRSHALVQQACPLTLSQSGFADLTYGYSQGNAALFTMRNDGLSEIRALSLGFDQGEGQFSLGALSKTVLAPGEEATFTVTAKTGLAAGSYPGRIRVSAQGMQMAGSCDFVQRVGALDISRGALYEAGASKPGIADRTYTGKAQTLAAGWSVKVGGVVLGSGDVAVSYRNNVNVASASSANAPTVVVSAKSGNVKDSFSVRFGIASSAVLADGTYLIRSALADKLVLDIVAGSTSDKANVQLYESNMTAAQKFQVSFDGRTGFYTFTNAKSGKALDVAGASTVSGANVQQYTSNGSLAQKWILARNKNGTYRIASALDQNLVLDVAAANASNGANVQLYRANGSTAQSFALIATNPAVTGSKTVDDGIYSISMSANRSAVLDVAAGSTSSGANIQIYTSNSTAAQKFRISYDGEGFYTVSSLRSGLPLEAADGNLVNKTNVRQAAPTSSAAQKWAISKNSDGTFTFVCKANGLALDVAAGSTANGANVQTYASNGSAAQRFGLTSAKAPRTVADGVYTIGSALGGSLVLDVA
ncbi:RICIN domain-containing protein, partial [Enteroscipio rubneri]|uniref:RICIN domain-containing protein n=1 Tax=Enteroscipio rubneri TaxID=2070686 RepID=UPI00164D3313